MMKEILIGNKKISREGSVFFIGEIGINHNGSLEIAKQIIDVAKMFGLEAVKFQKKVPELCVPESQKNLLRETPWGTMTYLDYKKKMELSEDDYKKIDSYCREKGIIWFASPWDIPSINFLEKFNVPCYKVPSAKLTDKEYLLKLKSIQKPVFLSTGMSTENEIKKAVKLLEGIPLVIMHSNSSYPAKDQDLNLRYIPKLLKDYPDSIIGYSGHEEGIAATLVAVALGATVIERHITIDRAMWGTDQAASIEIEGIRRLSRDLHKVNTWLGDGVKRVTDAEKKVKEKLRNVDTL